MDVKEMSRFLYLILWGAIGSRGGALRSTKEKIIYDHHRISNVYISSSSVLESPGHCQATPRRKQPLYMLYYYCFPIYPSFLRQFFLFLWVFLTAMCKGRGWHGKGCGTQARAHFIDIRWKVVVGALSCFLGK